MSTIFSAKIEAFQGMNEPAPIPEIEGWSVFKMDQIEIYKIIHNLELDDPEHQMHIVATPEIPDTFLNITEVNSNSFTVYTWKLGAVPKDCPFMFIAVCNLEPPSPPVLDIQ